MTSADWTKKDWDHFIMKLRTHTALGSANHTEVLTAFKHLAAQGYHIVQDTAALEGADA